VTQNSDGDEPLPEILSNQRSVARLIWNWH